MSYRTAYKASSKPPKNKKVAMNEEQKPGEVNKTSTVPPGPESTDTPVAAVAPTVGSVAQASSKKKLFGKLGIIPTVAIAGVLLLAGSAAGYFGIVLPNQPENVLKAAFQNTAKQTQGSFVGVGKFESIDPNAELKAFNIEFNGKADSQKNVYQAEMKFTASGVSLPVELRKVDTSLYMRFGDITTLQNLAATAAPEYTQIIALVGDKISNQWIEIDETLLKQAGADCVLNTSISLTDQDIQLIESRYESSPFMTVGSTASDTVNGRAAYKYDISVAANKASEFAKGLEELSFVKALQACSDDEVPVTEELSEDSEDTKLTLWVDKSSKTLVKVRSDISEAESEKSDLKGYMEVTMNYEAVTVDKPADARPAMEVLSELQALFMQGLTNGSSDVQGIFDFKNTTSE